MKRLLKIVGIFYLYLSIVLSTTTILFAADLKSGFAYVNNAADGQSISGASVSVYNPLRPHDLSVIPPVTLTIEEGTPGNEDWFWFGDYGTGFSEGWVVGLDEHICILQKEIDANLNSHKGYYSVSNKIIRDDGVEQFPTSILREIPSPNINNATNSQVDLAWDEPLEDPGNDPLSVNITGYVIYRSRNNPATGFSAISDVLTARTYTDTTFDVEGGTYYYSLALVYRGGVTGSVYSANSDPVIIVGTDSTPPTADISLANTEVSFNALALTINFSEPLQIADVTPNIELIYFDGQQQLIDTGSWDGNQTWAVHDINLIINKEGLVSINVSGVQDLAGNFMAITQNVATFSVDTIYPVAAAILSDSIVSDNPISTITLRFSEDVITTNVTPVLEVVYNSVSKDIVTDGLWQNARDWVVSDYQPTDNCIFGTVTINAYGVCDLFGNPMSVTKNLGTFIVDKKVPAISSVESPAGDVVDVAVITFNFDEAVQADSSPEVTFEYVGLGTETSGGTWISNSTLRVSYTVLQNYGDIVTVNIDGIVDAVGNRMIPALAIATFNVDTMPRPNTVNYMGKIVKLKDEGITFTWQKPDTAGKPDIVGYDYYLGPNQSGTDTQYVGTESVTILSGSVSRGVVNYLRVRAKDEDGRYSLWTTVYKYYLVRTRLQLIN